MGLCFEEVIAQQFGQWHVQQARHFTGIGP
jgi:hypothetical protein